MKKDFSKYNYDVVISFAEEQRDIAVAIKLALESKGLITYYYPYEQQTNLGLDLAENLKDIYRNSSFMGMAIFSESYFSKTYTKLELEALLSRLGVDDGYLIPVLLPNTSLEERLRALTYYYWDKDPLHLADLTQKKYEKRVGESLLLGHEDLSQMDEKSLRNYITRLGRVSIRSSKYHSSLGMAWLSMKETSIDYSKALECFKYSIDLSPNEAPVHYWYCQALIGGRHLLNLPYNIVKEMAAHLNTALALDSAYHPAKRLADDLQQQYFIKRGLKNMIIR